MILKLNNGKKVSLKFKRMGSKIGDDINIVACDKKGDVLLAGYLVQFRANGTLLLEGGVNRDIGFELEDYNHIKIS